MYMFAVLVPLSDALARWSCYQSETLLVDSCAAVASASVTAAAAAAAAAVAAAAADQLSS